MGRMSKLKPFRRVALIVAAILGAVGVVWRLSSSPPREVWVYRGQGVIRQPPLLTDALVLSAASGAPLTAIDLADGRARWSYAGEAGVWERSLAAAEDVVWIGERGGYLTALSAQDGHVLWRRALAGEVMVPPFVAVDVLYVVTTSADHEGTIFPEGRARVYALEQSDGTVRWSWEAGAYALQTPFVRDGRLWGGGSVYAPEEGIEEGGVTGIYALDATQGRLLWQTRTVDGFVKSLAVHEDVLVYLAYQDVIRALDAATGETLWQKDTGNWTPAFALADGVVYFGSANTQVIALDARSGEKRWQFDIPEGSFNYVLGAPAVNGGRVYFLTQRGDLMALDARNGHLIWHKPTDVLAAVGVRVAAPWLVLGDMQGQVHLYRLPEHRGNHY